MAESLPFRGTVQCEISGAEIGGRCPHMAFASYRLYPSDRPRFCCRDHALYPVMMGGGIYDGPLPKPNAGEALLMKLADPESDTDV